MIGIIDYGVGNVFSVMNALNKLGLKYCLVKKKEDFNKVKKLILPGVGAFDNAVQSLLNSNLFTPLRTALLKGMPTMGICLGMQLLCSASDEGELSGLCIFGEEVIKFSSNELIVPHMGWNHVGIQGSNNFTDVNSGYYYFVHSFYVPISEDTTGFVSYGDSFSAIIEKDNVIGVQFHPEKSGSFGLQLIKRFGEIL